MLRVHKLLLGRLGLASLFALVLLADPPLRAQAVNDGNTTGLPPFGSFHGSDFDLVALQNGNLHIDIPFARVPRRGSSFTYRFVYDTPTFELNTFQTSPTSQMQGMVSLSSDATGWRIPDPTFWIMNSVLTDHTCTSPVSNYQVRSMWTVTDPEGAKHPILLRYNSSPCAVDGSGGSVASQLTGYTLDGTGIFVDISSSPLTPRIVLKDGTQVSPPWTDSNGNNPLIGVCSV